MPKTTRRQGIAYKIEILDRIIARDSTLGEERDAAERARARLLASTTSTDSDATSGAADDRYYRLPDIQYGAKCDRHRSVAEIAKLLRADIQLARKLGRRKAGPGEVRFADPIGDAPRELRFYVKTAHASSITITVKNVPADWWIDEQPRHSDDPAHAYRAPGPRLRELGAALRELMWAYNYDGSDPLADIFNQGFHARVVADGHGQGPYYCHSIW